MNDKKRTELKELIREIVREELNQHNFNIHIHYPQQQSYVTTTSTEWAKPLWDKDKDY